MIKAWYAAIQKRLEARRRCRRAIAEIAALSERDLSDLGAVQSDLYRAVRQEFRSHAARSRGAA